VVAGLLLGLAGIWTTPLAAVPLAVGAVGVVLQGRQRPYSFSRWAGLVLGAFGATALAAGTTPALLGVPATALTGAEREVLLLVGALVAGGALVLRRADAAAVAGGSVAALAALPAPGADAVLPLVAASSAVLGASVIGVLTREPVSSRPHPLLRALLAVPVLVVVVVGALFLPARAPVPVHAELADWLTDTGSPVSSLTVPPVLWADLVRDGVPAERLRSTEGGVPHLQAWTVAPGVPEPGQRVRAVFGSGASTLTVLGPG
jgi:putative peptide zinc metalloprotease protein